MCGQIIVSKKTSSCIIGCSLYSQTMSYIPNSSLLERRKIIVYDKFIRVTVLVYPYSLIP